MDAQAVRDAYRQVAATNDVDVLVALFADDVVWNGVGHGPPWRRRTPS
jgi:ketosteroid isomerase-like protein